MSQIIDSKVVEMRFDNKEFESNAKSTINTLENLKRALNDNLSGEAFENLDRAARNVDLSSIEKSLDALTDRFSTMGIVGMRVIQNLTDGLMNLVHRGINYATDAIVSGGMRRAQNIENAHFQLQGLLDDEEKVKDIMQDALDSVDGTAYAYDEAAKAASMFAASGVEAGEQMQGALKAIAGVAATTNTDYERMANIFTTVAGQGKLMTQQLRQLESSGMNAAASMADYFNKVRDNQVDASEAVQTLVAQLSGSEASVQGTADAISRASDDIIEAQQRANRDEYKAKQKSYNAEYNELKKTLDAEYNLRRAAYDAEYNELSKALSKEYKAKQKAYAEEYNSLKKSLDAEYSAKKKEFDAAYQELAKTLDSEIQAVQKANAERLNDANLSYQQEVESYRKATNERIDLINEEYTESIKLIDEERYNKIKAAQDKIDAINAEAEAEAKAKKDSANATKKAELEEYLSKAKSSTAKMKAAELLAEFEEKLAEEQRAEERKNQIKNLQEEISNINDEANEKKKAAAEKRQSEIELVQEESNEKLKEMQKAHQEEMEAIQESNSLQIEQLRENRNLRLEELRTSQTTELNAIRENQSEQLNALKEKQQTELEALKETQSNRLGSLKESQSNELGVLKESQSEQLAVLKERQQEELQDFKDLQNDKLKELKKASKEGIHALEDFNESVGFTEAQIREMITDGMIDFDTFSEAMATTFGDHAKDANKTFTGAMANIRSAFAKIGALFYAPLIEQEGPLVGLLNAIRIKVNELKNELIPFADKITLYLNGVIIPVLTDFVNNMSVKLDSSSKTLAGIWNIMDTIYNIFKALGSVIWVVVGAFKELFEFDSKSFFETTLAIETFTSKLILSKEHSSDLAKVMKSIAKLLKSLWNIVKRTASAFSPLTKLFGEAADSTFKLSGGFADNIEKFANWLDTSKGIQAVFNTLEKVIDTFVNAILKAKDAISNFFTSLKEEGSGNIFTDIVDKVTGFFISMNKEGEEGSKGFLQGFVDGIVNFGKNVFDKITEFGTAVLSTIKKVLGIESPSKETFQYGVYLIEGFINGIKSVIETAIDFVRNGFTRIIEAIKEVFNGFNANEVDLDGESLGGNFITDFITGVKDHMPSPITAMIEFFNDMKEKILQMKIGHKTGEEYINQFIDGFKSIADKVKEKVAPVFEKVTNAISELFHKFADHDGEESGGAYILAFLKGAKDKFVDKASEVFNNISQAIKDMIAEVPKLKIIAAAVAAITTLVLVVEGIKTGVFSTLLKIFKMFKPLKLIFKGANFLKARENIEQFVDAIASKVSFIPENILSGFEEGLLKGNELITKVTEFFGRILQAIKDVFGIASPAKRIIEIAENIVHTFVDTIGKLIGPAADKIGEMFGSVIQSITKVFQQGLGALNGNEASLLSFVAGFGALLLLLKLMRRLDTYVGPFHKINALMFDMGKALKAFAFDTYAEGILKLAGAFTLIVGSLAGFIFAIEQLEDPNRVIGTILAVSVILANMYLLVKLILDSVLKIKTKNLSIFSDDPKQNFLIYIGRGIEKAMKTWTFAHTMSAFAKSVATIVLSIVGLAVFISKFSDKSALTQAYIVMGAIAGAVVIIGALGVFITAYAKKKEIDLAAGSGAVLKFAAATLAIAGTAWVIVDALRKLMELDVEADKFKDCVKTISLILLAVGALIGVYIWVSSRWQSKAQSLSASPLIGFAVLLWASMQALKTILSLDFNLKEDWDKLVTLGVLLIITGVIVGIITKVSGEAKGIVSSGGTILALCVWLYSCIGAIALLGNFDIPTLVQGIIAITFICIAMAIVLANATKDTGGSFKTVMAMCAVLAACLIALGVFSAFDAKTLWLNGVLPIVVILLVIAITFSQLAKVNTSVGMNKVVALVVALGVIAGGLWALTSKISGGGSWKKILSAAVAMSVVLAVYSGIMHFIGKQKYQNQSIGLFNKGLLMLIAVAGSLLLLSNGNFGGNWASILTAGIAMAGVILAFGVVFMNIARANVNKESIEQFLWGSLSLIVVAGALAAVAWADWSSILAAGGSIALVIEAYADVFLNLQNVNVDKETIHRFLFGAISLIMIGGALAACAWADWDSLLAAGGSIALVIEAYCDVFTKLQGVNVELGTIGKFLLGIVGVILISGTIGALAHLCDWDDLLASATGISAVLVAYKDVFTNLSGVQVKTKDIGKFLLGCVSIAIIGAVIAGTILLSGVGGQPVDWKMLAAAAGGIALVLYVMSKVMTVLAGIKGFDIWPSVGALIGAAIGAILIAVALNSVENTDGAIQAAVSLSIVLVAMCVVLGIVNFIGDAIAASGGVGAIVGIVALDAFIADLVGILEALGHLTDMEILKDGKDKLIMIGQAFGGFFGAIIEGFTDQVGEGIAKIGQNLSEFMKNAQPFFDGLEQFDESMQQKAEAFANVALALSGSSFVSAIADLIDAVNPFSKGMKDKFSEFGASITAFAEETKDINGWNTKNAAEACKYLAEALSELNPVKDFFASLELDALGDRFKKMGKAISGVLGSEGFNGVPNPENYKAVSDSVLALTALFDPKNPNGHLASRDFNDAEDLPELGESLKKFAVSVSVIGGYAKYFQDITPFENLVAVGQKLLPLCTTKGYMVTNDSLLGLAWGTNDPASLGNNLINFARFMVGTSINDVSCLFGVLSKGWPMNEAMLDMLVSCSGKLFQIAGAVPTTNEGLQWFLNGDNNIKTFGENMVTFVDKMVEIQGKLKDSSLVSTDFTNFKSAMSVMFEITETLKSLYLTEDDKVINMAKNIKDFGEAFEDFGKNIKKFGSSAEDGYDGFDGAVELLEKFVELIPDLMSFDGTTVSNFFKSLKETAQKGLQQFLDEYNKSEGAVNKVIATMFSYIGEAITSKKNLMESYGRVVVGYFTGDQGLTSENSISKCKSAMAELVNRMGRDMDLSGMVQLGVNAARGFANGLISNDAIGDIQNAAHTFGSRVYSEIAHTLAINSPSKKTAELGLFTAEGFINGLLSLAKAAGEAGSEVGESASDGLRMALEKISSDIQNEDQFNPVITPVLDLSNIEENAGAIGGILNLDKPLGLAANAGMSFTGGLNNLLGSIQASIPDGSNGDVVTAINEMRADMVEMSAAIRQMQIVMDTGELVGAITDPIDQQLGFNSVLSSRGVKR